MKTEEELFNELSDHLEFTIEHGGFAIGTHAQGGCSCNVCDFLRGYLMLRYYTENKKMPEGF